MSTRRPPHTGQAGTELVAGACFWGRPPESFCIVFTFLFHSMIETYVSSLHSKRRRKTGASNFAAVNNQRWIRSRLKRLLRSHVTSPLGNPSHFAANRHQTHRIPKPLRQVSCIDRLARSQEHGRFVAVAFSPTRCPPNRRCVRCRGREEVEPPRLIIFRACNVAKDRHVGG